MSPLTASETVQRLLDRIVQRLHEALSSDLVGVYLHGSLAFGCFNPNASDIDLIIVVETRLTNATKRSLVAAFLDLTHDAPTKGIEASVVTRESLPDLRHPAPYELHFSNDWVDRFRADDVDLNAEQTDPDLVAHYAVLRARGICLWGTPIEQVVPPVPRSMYLDSIASDLEWAKNRLPADAGYLILNCCRAVAFAHKNLVLSKAEGAEWALLQLPSLYHAQIRLALAAYSGTPEAGVFDSDVIDELSEFAIATVLLAALAATSPSAS